MLGYAPVLMVYTIREFSRVFVLHEKMSDWGSMITGGRNGHPLLICSPLADQGHDEHAGGQRVGQDGGTACRGVDPLPHKSESRSCCERISSAWVLT